MHHNTCTGGVLPSTDPTIDRFKQVCTQEWTAPLYVQSLVMPAGSYLSNVIWGNAGQQGSTDTYTGPTYPVNNADHQVCQWTQYSAVDQLTQFIYDTVHEQFLMYLDILWSNHFFAVIVSADYFFSPNHSRAYLLMNGMRHAS